MEAVCLRAMAGAPDERYASPRALADDIEHWLADEPVTAYGEPLVKRLSRWGRRHKPVVAGAGALLLTLMVTLSITDVLLSREQARTRQAQRDRAFAQVEALLNANIQVVPHIIETLEPFRDWVIPRLCELRVQPDLSEKQRMRASLALLSVHREEMNYLRDRLLDCSGDEFPVILDRLQPFDESLRAGLWQTLRTEKLPAQARFHAGMALASFAARARSGKMRISSTWPGSW